MSRKKILTSIDNGLGKIGRDNLSTKEKNEIGSKTFNSLDILKLFLIDATGTSYLTSVLCVRFS